MTRLTFECPETGKPLTAMTVDDREASVRLMVHCPKCSQLHVFEGGDAVEQQEVALAVSGGAARSKARVRRISGIRPM